MNAPQVKTQVKNLNISVVAEYSIGGEWWQIAPIPARINNNGYFIINIPVLNLAGEVRLRIISRARDHQSIKHTYDTVRVV